jgi:PKD repeat protein
MQPATTARKKQCGIPVAVLGVIVILVCMSLIPPASALEKSIPITITAIFNPAKPAAQFTSDYTEGLAPLTVTFKDLTTGGPVSWVWSFGDGTTSDQQNPTHTYSASGLYTVSLSVTFALGGVPTKTEVTNYIGAYASSYNLIFNTPGLTGTTDITFIPSQFPGTYTLIGNVLTLTYPDGSPFKELVITFSPAPVTQPDGTITGHVLSATLETKDLAGSLINGVEQHSIIFYLTAVPPPGSGVQTDTIDKVDPQNLAAFVALAAGSGLTLVGTYYEMFVDTTIPANTILSMGIKMALPSGWNSPGITIIGVGPGGNAGIIPTISPTTSGGFIVFNAPSFTGYDTFGLALLRGPALAPSSGDTGGGEDLGPAPAAEQAAQAEAAQAQQGMEQLGPTQEGTVASSSVDLSIDGFSVTSDSGDGKMNLTINRTQVEKSGANVTVVNNTVTIVHPMFSIVFVCVKVTEINGIIHGEDVLSIVPTTTPLEGIISGETVSAWLNTRLYNISSGAMITTSLAEPVNKDINDAFGVALKDEGKDIQAIDYTMTVTKTNITATHSANISMTATPAWVEANGGIDSVYIVRIPDTPTLENPNMDPQVLKTTWIGNDTKGNMIFEAFSPDGLSVFGLVTAKATVTEMEENPNATVAVASKSMVSTNVGMYAWILSVIEQNPLILVILLAVIAVLAYFGWWKRRL